ncbi:MAG TPA: energy transducer TonB [Armatimonadota bacterium]|nr:energy transducer TonB [Armatimonadota bacterium]
MDINLPTSSPAAVVDEGFSRRLTWACTASVLLNLLLWWAFAHVVRHRPAPRVIPVTIIEMRPMRPKPAPPKPKQPKPKPKIPKPPPLRPRVRPQPVLRPVVRRPAVTKPQWRPRPVGRVIAASPERAPSHAPTVAPNVRAAAAPSTPAEFTTAPSSAPTDATPGNDTGPARHNFSQSGPAPDNNPGLEPSAAVVPVAPHHAAAGGGGFGALPRPIGPVTAPHPPPPAPPAAAGPTQEAQPVDEVKPTIPEDVETTDFHSSVRVKVTVRADGSFTPTLLTTSGNAEIDQRVREALKQWKWKPALKDGVPVSSSAYFLFNFLVQ